MARARNANAGFWWAIVVLAAGSVLFGLLAIIFYTRANAYIAERDEAVSDLRAVATQAELDGSAVSELRSSEVPGTILGKFVQVREDLKAQLGAAQDEARNLQAAVSAAQRETEGLRNQLTQQQQAVAQARQEQEGARTAYEQRVNALQQQVQQVDTAMTQVRGRADQLSQSLSGDLAQVRNDLQARITDLEAQLRQSGAENADLTARLGELTAERDERIASVTRPDARIASVLDDGRRVYLDIGRNQRLQLGMTFEVFTPDTLVKLEDEPAAPGKATVEVYELFDNTATARVVRRDRNARLTVGDAAVNLVYDRNREFTFVVYGDFDLDRDGEANPADRDRIVSLVQQWGGNTADDLDFSADYLVLGVPPDAPDELTAADRANPIRIREYNEQLERFNAYQNLRGRAIELGIPVLNQNRFLDLVGYYER